MNLRHIEHFFYDINGNFKVSEQDNNTLICEFSYHNEYENNVKNFLKENFTNISQHNKYTKKGYFILEGTEDNKVYNSFLNTYLFKKELYKITIKSVFDLNDKLDQLKRVLDRYKVVNIGKVEKSIFQSNPLDFYDLDNYEVYSVVAETEYPVSAYIVTQELCYEFGVSEKFVVVRSENDPLEKETIRQNINSEIMKDNDSTSLLSTNNVSDESEASIDGKYFYGNEYNKAFLNFLSGTAKERKNDETVFVSDNDKPEFFSWLISTKSEEDFNKDYDTPKPINNWDAKEIEKNIKLSKYNNFSDDFNFVKVVKSKKTNKRNVAVAPLKGNIK